jgi:hypothetical protein
VPTLSAGSELPLPHPQRIHSGQRRPQASGGVTANYMLMSARTNQSALNQQSMRTAGASRPAPARGGRGGEGRGGGGRGGREDPR